MQLETEKRVTAERERELLRKDSIQNFDALKHKSKSYKETLQRESLEGLPEYRQWVYRVTDYLKLTTPDERLQKKLKFSEASCTRQQLLVQQYESKIRQQERLALEKEQELRDCEFCYEKRKSQIQELDSRQKALFQEKNSYLQLLKHDENSFEASEMVSKISAQLGDIRHKKRIIERERNEFASKVVECDSAIKESENTLLSLGVYSSVLQKSYIRSRMEIMRLKPLISSSSNPVETIDTLVENQKIAEQTEKIADTVSQWIFDITSDISEVAIRTKRRSDLYGPLREKREESVSDITALAERIIYEKNNEQ